MSAVFQFNVLADYPPLNTIGGASIPSSDPFYRRGNDFLNPNFIGSTVSNVVLGSGTTYLGKNPSAKTILNRTNGQVDGLLNGGTIGAIASDIKLYNDPAIYGPVPDVGVNPGAMRILANTSFFQDAFTAAPFYSFSVPSPPAAFAFSQPAYTPAAWTPVQSSWMGWDGFCAPTAPALWSTSVGVAPASVGWGTFPWSWPGASANGVSITSSPPADNTSGCQ